MWIKSEIFDENGKHLDRGLNLRPQYHVMISTEPARLGGGRHDQSPF